VFAGSPLEEREIALTMATATVQNQVESFIGMERPSVVLGIDRVPTNEVRRKSRTQAGLLLEHQGWTTDSIPFEVDTHLDAVGNLYERYAAVHSVFLAVKGHNP
jgi:hypothetical protein